MKKPQAIIFDVDGTLIDHERAAQQALLTVKSARREFDEVNIERLHELWTEDFNTFWKPVVTGEISLEENRVIRFLRIFRSLGLDSSREDAAETALIYGRTYDSEIRGIPGASELIRELRKDGIGIGIVTNNTYDNQIVKLKKSGYEGQFDYIVTSERTGAMKPDPAIFESALELSGKPAESTVMIGDSFGEDIIGAHNAGLKPVWFNRFNKPHPTAQFKFVTLNSYLPTESALRAILNSGTA